MTTEAEATPIDDALLRGWPLPDPGDDGDKEARGRVLILAGCPELPGTPILCAEAALRAGAGRVLLATPAAIAVPVGAAVPEARMLALADDEPAKAARRMGPLADQSAALLAGPGMLDEAFAGPLAEALLRRPARLPAVLDAGALRAVTAAPHERPPVLITPHAGELAHLSGATRSDIEADPANHATAAARRWNAVVVLKGPTTWIASPDGKTWRHDGGQAGLATAGSGDVLAGLMAGLLARRCTLEQAAVWAVALHARAGTRLAQRAGRLGWLAREIAAEVPRLLDDLAGSAD